jgi:membrane protein DedA with SNARE-associated domain
LHRYLVAILLGPAVLSTDHHHFHGSAVEYVGIAVAAAASWAGVPGPGEATVIGAGLLAAGNELDIGGVLLAAWAGATAGGIAGWLIGLMGGRALVAAPGPLLRYRVRVLSAGERFYERFGMFAVILTPSWIAGIARMRWTRYLPANALSALLWALVVGLGSYVLGPAIKDVVADLGLGLSLILVALIAATLAGRLRRDRHRH